MLVATAGGPAPLGPDSSASKGGVLETTTVVLLDERLGVARSRLRDDPPSFASPRKMPVAMLTPDNGNPLPLGFLDKAADVRGDRSTPVRRRDDAVLNATDEKRCGRLIRLFAVRGERSYWVGVHAALLAALRSRIRAL